MNRCKERVVFPWKTPQKPIQLAKKENLDARYLPTKPRFFEHQIKKIDCKPKVRRDIRDTEIRARAFTLRLKWFDCDMWSKWLLFERYRLKKENIGKIGEVARRSRLLKFIKLKHEFPYILVTFHCMHPVIINMINIEPLNTYQKALDSVLFSLVYTLAFYLDL